MLTGRTEKIKGELDQAAADMADARALKEEYDAKLKIFRKKPTTSWNRPEKGQNQRR